MVDNYYKNLVDKAYSENNLKKEELIYLIKDDEQENRDYLYHKADELRRQYHGNIVHLRAIIEFSSYCKRSCYYCGLRKDNQELKRYQLAEKEIIDMAEKAGRLGYKTVVLQSGEDEYNAGKMARVIRKIKEKVDAAVTLCLGERDYEEYRLWREAGADRYLLKHEVADRDLYQQLHPDMDYDQRIKRLTWLKELGYQVGSGNIIGLPDQTEETLAEDILLFKKLDLDMAGIGPFIPHPATPLAEVAAGTVNLTLDVLALTRLLLPLSHLPATTALGTIDDQGREKALKAGANVVMPNVTETDFRSLYEIYPSKICINEKAADCRQCIGGKIRALGYEVADDYGDSLKVKES